LLPVAKIEQMIGPLFRSSEITDFVRIYVAITLVNIVDTDKVGSFAVDDRFIEFLLKKVVAVFNGDDTKWYITSFTKGIANLAVNDHNQRLMGEVGFMEILVDILQIDPVKTAVKRLVYEIEKTKNEASEALWNLSYDANNRKRLVQTGGLQKIKDIASRKDITETVKNNIEGVLWLMEGKDKESEQKEREKKGKSLPVVLAQQCAETVQHVMLSYSWSQQATAKRISDSLKRAGYNVWLDIEHMKGSTLEIMAEAVENASCVLICMSRKYKDSPHCRMTGEYVNNVRKSFIPIMMESNYKPDGWLGILLGGRLWYDYTNEHRWEEKMQRLVLELGDRGRIGGVASGPSPPIPPQIESWSRLDVGCWLNDNDLKQYKELFEHQDIDGAALAELGAIGEQSKTDLLNLLKNDFAISSAGQRLKLVRRLAQLTKG